MSDSAKPVILGRPRPSHIEHLATQWLAQRLVERIPEYAASRKAKACRCWPASYTRWHEVIIPE